MGTKKGLDLVGQTFSKLTVLKDTGKRNPRKGKVWLCQCECGNPKEVATSHLLHGNTRSCGCLAKSSGKRTNTSNRKSRVLKDIPEELKCIPSKIVQNGLFEVFENGRIFRITDRGKVECSLVKTGKNSSYQAVTRMVDGKQKLFYVHRLIAEAFIPNPENKSQINHKDGNGLNNSLDNLEWVTPSENVRHAYKNGLHDPFINGTNCIDCGRLTRGTKSICPSCKNKRKLLEKRKETVEAMMESVSDIDISLITPKQREAVELRKQGKTLEEIAGILNITKQGVEVRIRSARERAFKLKSRRKVKAVDFKVIGDVKLLRLKNGLRLSDMADLLNISTPTYRQKELDVRRFNIAEANKLANLFDLSLDDLFGTKKLERNEKLKQAQ